MISKRSQIDLKRDHGNKKKKKEKKMDNWFYRLILKLNRKWYYWFNSIQGKNWIKMKRRSVRLNIDHDTIAWLQYDLEDLNKSNPERFRSSHILNMLKNRGKKYGK